MIAVLVMISNGLLYCSSFVVAILSWISVTRLGFIMMAARPIIMSSMMVIKNETRSKLDFLVCLSFLSAIVNVDTPLFLNFFVCVIHSIGRNATKRTLIASNRLNFKSQNAQVK